MVRANVYAFFTALLGTASLASAQSIDITNYGGVVSDQYATTAGPESVAKVVDDDPATKYLTRNPTTWIQFQTAFQAVVTRYSLTSGNDAPTRDPRDWIFQGSTDGMTWTTLDAQSGQLFAARGLEKEYAVANGTPYPYYRLTVTANNGNTLFQLAEWKLWATILGGPAAPSDLAAAGASGHRIDVSWRDNAADETRYVLERLNDGTTAYAPLATLGADTTRYVDENVAEGTRYYYRIYAQNEAGPSASTSGSGATATTGAGLADITDFTGAGSDAFDTTGAEGIARLFDSSPFSKYLTFHPTTWVQWVSDAPHVVTRYALTSGNDAPERDPRDWTFEASNDGVAWTPLSVKTGQGFTSRQQKRAYSFDNATAYRYYRLDVQANNGGPIVQIAELEIFGAGGGAIPPLVAPTNLAVVAPSSHHMIVTWDDNAASETSYRLERSTDGTTWSGSTLVGASHTRYVASGLAPGSTYHFRVRAENAAEVTDYSAPASATLSLIHISEPTRPY